MESIAERLIALRNKYNFSKSDIARLLGVTPALISAYENNERNPSIDRLIVLADIFHVSTDYILGRTTMTDSAKVINIDGLSGKQVKIVRDLITEFKK